MNWYLGVIKRYAVFSGRAHRKEYWYFTLIDIIIAAVLGVPAAIMALNGAAGASAAGTLANIYGLGLFIPRLAVTARRLHDTNRSGWFLLMGFIPAILMIAAAADAVVEAQNFGLSRVSPEPLIITGLLTLITSIILIVWLAKDGAQGDNRFGSDPKTAD